MKRFALLVLFVLALAAPALAINTVGDISVYADDQGNACNVSAPGNPVPFNVYVVHKFGPGEQANGSRFKVVFPAGMTYFAFTSPFTAVGSLPTDISLGYGVCISSTTSLGSALVQAAVAVPDCSYISVQIADNQPRALATSCIFEELTVGIGQAIVNPTVGCQCNIATQPTSWGRVKALYR